MKFLIDLNDNTFTGPLTLDSKVQIDKSSAKPLFSFLDGVSKNAWIETDLLPVSDAGLLAYRAAYGYEQIIYQMPAGTYSIKWGEYESDKNAVIYSLAHPWKVIIADFHQGAFIGLRHFFSPEPISHWDQTLYAVNLPNTNTKGYNGTSIGWVCLYHKDDTTKYTLSQKIDYCIQRESGFSEPYNNRNMSGTDGPRFYQAAKSPDFMWNPTAWQKRTVDYGYEWICDEKLLIPLHVASDGHAESYSITSPAYTLRRASYDQYSAYYYDHTYDKPFNILFRNGYDPAHKKFWLQPLVGGPQQELTGTKEKVIKTADEILTDPIDFKFTDKVLNSIKLGWLCECCNQVTSFDIAQVPVVKDYEYNFENRSLKSTTNVLYCNVCLDEYAIWLDSYAFYTTFDNVVYSEYQDLWDFPERTYFCPPCGSAYFFNNSIDSFKVTPFLVYSEINSVDGLNNSAPVGCVNCLKEEAYVTTDFHDLRVMKTHVVSYDKIKLALTIAPVDNQNATIEQMVPTIERITYYSPTSVFKQKDDIICRCKLLTTSKYIGLDAGTDSPVCNSCIKDSHYESFINNLIVTDPEAQKTQVSPS